MRGKMDQMHLQIILTIDIYIRFNWSKMIKRCQNNGPNISPRWKVLQVPLQTTKNYRPAALTTVAASTCSLVGDEEEGIDFTESNCCCNSIHLLFFSFSCLLSNLYFLFKPSYLSWMAWILSLRVLFSSLMCHSKTSATLISSLSFPIKSSLPIVDSTVGPEFSVWESNGEGGGETAVTFSLVLSATHWSISSMVSCANGSSSASFSGGSLSGEGEGVERLIGSVEASTGWGEGDLGFFIILLVSLLVGTVISFSFFSVGRLEPLFLFGVFQIDLRRWICCIGVGVGFIVSDGGMTGGEFSEWSWAIGEWAGEELWICGEVVTWVVSLIGGIYSSLTMGGTSSKGGCSNVWTISYTYSVQFLPCRFSASITKSFTRPWWHRLAFGLLTFFWVKDAIFSRLL